MSVPAGATVRFLFEVENESINKAFCCDADDIVAAMLFAMEFVERVNAHIKRVSEEVSPVRIRAVVQDENLPANEEGIEQFMDAVRFQYDI